MNSDVSDKMIGIAETLHKLTSIITRCYKNDKRIAYYADDPLLTNVNDTLGPYMKTIDINKSPVGCIMTPSGFLFGYVRYNENMLVLGPVSATQHEKAALIHVANAIDPTCKYHKNIIDSLSNCPNMTEYTIVPLLAHAFKLLTFSDSDRTSKYLDLFLSSVIDISFFDNTTPKITSRHCSLEWLFESIIEEGNMAAIEQWYSANPYLHFETRITDDKRRDALDCFVMMTTLYAKAASRGGLDRQYTFEIQLNAMRAAEQMDKVEDILSLQTNLAIEYTREVAEIKKNASYSKLVQSAIQIMNRDIYGTVNISDMAKELFVSRGHLSKTFHQETGTTLNDFIIHVKIREAKKLLLHSNMSLETISKMLGFSTQSYFTKVFRESTDMTPRRYRLLGKES